MSQKQQKTYSVAPAKIGSQDGYRLPRAFSKDHPELVGAGGYVEVINENTLLVRLDPTQEVNEDEEKVMISLFLDFLMSSAIEEPNSLIPYTSAMSEEAKELLAGVNLDED